MDRFLNYLNGIIDISDSAKDFLRSHGKTKIFSAGAYYKFSDEKVEKWCFMLEGIAARIDFQHDKEVIERVYCKNYYFSGTKHVFSTSSELISLKFLRKSHVYEISNHYLRVALQQYPDLRDCYLILKEKEIQFIKDILSILKHPIENRIYELNKRQPYLLNTLTVKEKMSFLNIKNLKDYYAALDRFIYFK